ncbi:MAG TPA: hypothetical protein VFB38_17065 [Chthonomonadaceae bacterium]|nr:hypothetical protein [Chthonomonadaceae bacterium]
MSRLLTLWLIAALLCTGALATSAKPPAKPRPAPPDSRPKLPPQVRVKEIEVKPSDRPGGKLESKSNDDLIQVAPRIRPLCPVRLGGIYTLGLGDGSADMEESAALGVKLSADNQRWIAANCDVIALNAVNITPETFPAIVKAQRLFTPLLIASASALYERDDQRANVGGWKPEMAAWTLRDGSGNEIAHPAPGGHWMDFANPDWAAHWRDRALALTRQYSAQGVVATQLPLNNPFVGEDLARYRTPEDRITATTNWLRAARAANRFFLIPAAMGFDLPAGHTTLVTPPGTEEPNLPGRLWDDYFGLIDGAWDEGWVYSYRDDVPQPENLWEIALEAADRAGRNGQVFIACAAYHNDVELEYDLASYLLIVHNQGRCVFQPMPLLPDERRDAGFSLAVLRKQVSAKSAYFNVPLGVAVQERHLVPAEGGTVWRRVFQGGVVYVNSDAQRGRTILLGGEMQRVTGARVRKVDLPPQSGVILLFPTK